MKSVIFRSSTHVLLPFMLTLSIVVLLRGHNDPGGGFVGGLLAVIVLLKGKVWTGLVGMFITPLLVVGAIRLSRPHAPWARWRYTKRPRKMHRALERERWLRRPVVQAKLWLQDAIAGMPKFPDDAKVNEQLDREIHAAPAPPDRESDNRKVA